MLSFPTIDRIKILVIVLAEIIGLIVGILTEQELEILFIIEGTIIVLGVFIAYLIDQIRFRKPINSVLKLYKQISTFHSEKMQENIQQYVNETRNDLSTIVEDLKDGEADLDEWQNVRFLNIVFKTKIHYEAIDVTLPSEYQKKYPTYLKAHKQSLDPSSNKQQGYRVITRESVEIERDSRTAGFSKFWEWHDNNNVGLYHLSHTRVKIIIRNNGIDPDDCTLGIGIWGDEFAILFSKSNDERKKRVKVFDKTNVKFRKIQTICKEIKEESEVMKRTGSPRIMKKPFIAGWKDFVNPEKRWANMKLFMYNFLDECRKEQKIIIDIAAGIGIEYFYMIEDGFLMHCNEVQDDLEEEGVKYGHDNGYKIKYSPSRHTWLELVENGMEGMYGGLFATGNSLRMIGSKQDQQAIIKQFYQLLQNGGTIIIDERNHERLLKYVNEINLCGTEKNDSEIFKKLSTIVHQVHNPLYHGANIQSIPYHINSEKNIITYCYYQDHDKISNLNEAEDYKIQDWLFYHHERLEDLLHNAGFVEIEKYADYDLNKKLKLREDVDDASMFVYVAKKPMI